MLFEQYAPCLEVRAELLPVCTREADREETRTAAPHEVREGSDTAGFENLDLADARPQGRAVRGPEGEAVATNDLRAEGLAERLDDGPPISCCDDDPIEVGQHRSPLGKRRFVPGEKNIYIINL